MPLTRPRLHTDPLTIDQFYAGDSAAFTCIYNQYYPELFLVARRLTGEKAPDIVADVFLTLWTKRPRLENPQHLLAYLRTMTRNACLQHLRQLHRQQALLSEFAAISDREYEEQYFREIIESRLFALIRHEIDQLPHHVRQVFVLAYIDGLSNARIAETLRLRDSSVRTLKSEALKQLRAALYDVELAVLLSLTAAAQN